MKSSEPKQFAPAIAEFGRIMNIAIEHLQERLQHELDQGKAAKTRYLKQRKIAAHIPAMVYIAAKEAAGFGEEVKVNAAREHGDAS